MIIDTNHVFESEEELEGFLKEAFIEGSVTVRRVLVRRSALTKPLESPMGYAGDFGRVMVEFID